MESGPLKRRRLNHDAPLEVTPSSSLEMQPRGFLFNVENDDDSDSEEKITSSYCWDPIDQFPTHEEGDGFLSHLFKRNITDPLQEELKPVNDISTGKEHPHATASVPSASDDNQNVLLYYSSIPIMYADLKRLKPGIFLNDNLIDFGLNVWLNDLEVSNPELSKQIHLFGSFFYKNLSSEANLKKAYEKVKKWVKHDIFQKRYIIVPINENYHWYLAIIYEPEHIMTIPPRIQTEVNDNNIPKTYIFTFDSLGGEHVQAVKRLTNYLKMEAKFKMGVKFAGIAEGRAASVPLQSNFSDCGIYLLHFAKTFMSDPKKYSSTILSPSDSIPQTARKAIWLVDKHFERTGRKQLRLRIDILSKDWKKTVPNRSQDADDYSDVEIVESFMNP